MLVNVSEKKENTGNWRELQGQPEVLALLDPHSAWVSQQPPKYIRALLYKYHFTAWGKYRSGKDQ